ncbi:MULTISPECIES: hypothetical protein [Aestuariibaculum]|uniref:Uncharacterized protein n=1 Tax=Aestuariibaculum lutulentum TaxID=2920935 RepID=A0ABS9RI24_9FLAO|nr:MULTISPECIES: hypothetical protein [Aestuariibaculum]MCH4551772.1 hypothetical protein [Aestuariibaculum lutulentum]MCR8666877.1 hypothetical protein [Aestuariibaculum sp. M13]
MLLFKLKELECAFEKQLRPDEKMKKAVSALKMLFLKIDYKNEILPEFSFEKVVEVLEDVNGRELTGRQKLVVKHIMFYGD